MITDTKPSCVVCCPAAACVCKQVAQTAAQPGILTCWLDLLSLTSNSAEFYCAPIPDALRDKPFVEMRRWGISTWGDAGGRGECVLAARAREYLGQ